MDQVNLELKIATDKADAAMAATARKGRDLFEKRGFNLNLKSNNLPLGRITGDFDKFSGSLDAATARVLAFTATTTVVYGLSTAFSRLFTDSIKLEKQLASIQSILQTSNANLQKFSSELFNVANATGQSFDVAAAAASEFARQGLSVEETLKATNAALAFSKIAGADAAQAVENLTASLNTFANESLSYTDVVDTIVSLDNAFAISAAGIADGLKRVGSVASESGIQLKEIASLISVVQQVSARGAPVISNGLKTIFTRLSRTSVQEALNNIGVATQNSNGEFRSQIEVLTDLSNRLDSLSDSQRAFVLEQVAGVYQINTLQATLKSLRGEYSLFDKAVKVASDSSGNAAERLKILTNTTDANLQKLKNNVTQFLAEVGKATVKPLLDNFVGIGNTILDTLNLGSAGEAGEKAGNSIGKFLLNGISSVLSGPGTVLLVVGISKLLTKVTKDAFVAVQTLAGLKKTSLVDEKVQSSINKAIEMGNQALVKRLATTTSIVEKARILKALMDDMDRRQGVAQVNQAVSAGLEANKKARGFRGASKSGGYIPTYSEGFIPNFAGRNIKNSVIPEPLKRIEKKGALAGGYNPKKITLSSTGKVVSTAETEAYHEDFSEPFINPPPYSMAGRRHKKRSIQKTGIDPYSLMASGGFIPNFAYTVTKQNLGKNSVISIDGNVTGRQSSLVADSNIDKVENLKYKVRQVTNDYNNNFKDAVLKYKSSGYKDSDWQAIESQLKSGKYQPDQIKTFKKNLESKETTGPSLVNGKKVSISRQITGIQSKLKGAYFENVVGNFLGKAISRNKVKTPESQNSRMDLLNSQGYSLGEIKSGNFSYDNLVSKAIASLSEETNVKYSNRIPQKIEFRKPYSLFVPAPTSSGGFIPNFASRYTEARKQKRDELRASLFNIGDFAGGAIKNINAQTEFNQARDKNPNVEFDDKINQVGFKVERIPIPDKQFEAGLRSKINNKEVTTKFENYAIDYLNTKGYSFKQGRDTLYGKDNASVDGYNIRQNFIELLEVKGGKWDSPDVSNKFGRFAPENLVDLAPQLASKFFKEGNPDPNINDKIRIRNVLAIPALTGGVFKSNINTKYPSADLKAMEKARQKKTGNKIPAKYAWMAGLINQGPVTNFSGFIPNFASRLSYKETQKAQKEAIDREVASGQKRKNVKVGKSNSLRTALNPMGFGVFNKDEKTLANGMSLAKKEGIDPRTKGMFASDGFIPNFAESPYIKAFGQNASPQQIARFNELYINNVEARRAAGKIGGKGGMDTKKSEVRNRKVDATRAVKQIYQEEGVKRGNQSKAKPQPAPQNPESRISLPKTDSRLSITTPVNPGVSSPSPFSGINSTPNRADRTAGTSIPSGPTIPMSGPIGRSPEEQAKRDKEAKKLRDKRLKSQNSNARLGAMGALAFSIPAITGALSTPAEGKEQTTTQKNIQAGGEALGAGLAAATTAALIPGLAPFAPAIGAVVGGFKLLTSVSKNAVPSIEGITKQNQKLIESNEKQLTSLNSAVQKTEEISQLKSSGADPRKIAKAEIELSKSLMGIGDKELVNTLKNEKDDTKKQEAILAFQEKKAKERNLSESVTTAATLAQQAQTERAGGFKGTLGGSLDVAAQITEFFGGKGAVNFVKPVSELIRGPKQDFGTEQWDQFINPIIDSLDLSKLTSEEAAKGLKRLAGGTQDLGSFIRQFGAEAGMSSSQIQQITQSLNSLSSAYSPESIASLNQYTGGVIKLNQQLASSAVAKSTPVVNVNFQKVFDKALQDLTLDTALTNYKQFSDKGANISIGKNQFALDQQAGKFSQTQIIRKQSQIQAQEETLGFNKEGTDIVTSAVEKLLAIIPKDLNNDQRSAIVQESKNVLTRGGDLTKLEDLIRDSVANTGKSNDILEEIAKINEETTQSVEKLKVDRATATKTRTAVEEATIKAAQDAAASQRGADIISGAAAQAPKGKLLDVKLLAENNAKIEKLTAQAQLAGGNRTERGRSIINQVSALELQNARMREQDLIAQSTAFGAPNVTGQEEAVAANKAIGEKDFAKNLAAETGNLLQQLNASKAQKGERQLFSSKDIKSITQGIEMGGEGAVQARALIEGKLGDTSRESQVNQDIINRVKTLGGEKSIFNDKKPPSEEPRPAWEAATQRLAQESLTGRMGSDELLRSQTTGLKDQAVSEAEAAKKEADAAREALDTLTAKETEMGKSKAAQTQGANRAKIQSLEESLGSVGRTTWDEKGFGGRALTAVLNSPIGAIPQGVAAGYQKLGIAPNSGPLFGDYGYGQKKQSPEAQQTSADLSSFLDKIKLGSATQSDFDALKKSLDDKGRSTEDIADRQKFIKGIEDLQIPFAEDNEATLAEKKKNLQAIADEKQAIADQKNAAAEVAKKNVENFAGDPSRTLKFLEDPKQKADALRKLKESKDPNLKSLGDRITSLDLKKEELKKIKDQEELSGLTLSKTPLNEQQMKRKAELESAGVKSEELSTSQKERKKELEAGIGKDTNAIIAEGKRSYGAINSALYKDQVAPGVLDLVQKKEDRAKIESYNAKVLERQAQESELSTTNEEITGIQAQEAQRRKVSSAFLADTGSSMSLDEKYAVTSRFNKGEITAEEANQLTGGALKNAYKSVTNKEDGFENLNNIGNIQTKLGNRERLQQGVEKAKAQESELSKAMQPVLEAITGFANAQAAATEAQAAAAQEEKAKKEAEKEAGTPTTEGGEKKITTTSNVNVTVTGGSLTDAHVAQLEQNLKTYSAETIITAFKNAGFPAPNLGPPETTAIA